LYGCRSISPLHSHAQRKRPATFMLRTMQNSGSERPKAVHLFKTAKVITPVEFCMLYQAHIVQKVLYANILTNNINLC
jgi:hypothetical protein